MFGLTGEELPEIVGCDQIVGDTDVFGPTIPVAGLIVDQQAALLAESCLAPGDAKCTFGTGAFLLAQLGTNATRSTSGLTTSVAWRLRDHTAYCVDGQVYTAASAVRWAVDLGLVPAADQIDVRRSRFQRRRVVRARAGRARGAVVGLRGRRVVHRDDAEQRTRTLVRALLEGIAAQVAALAELVASDLGAAVDTAAGRRRADPVRGAHAGPGRPGAHPRRRLPVIARHRTRRGRMCAAGPRYRPRRGRRRRHMDTATTPTSPNGPPNRAAEFMSRWMRAAESVLVQKESTTT